MAATGDYVWKPRTVEDSVDAGVHPAVAAMRLNGGVQPQLNLNKLGIDPSRPDWGSNKSGTALVDQLGFLRVTKPDTPAWAMAEEGLAPKSKKQKKEKKKKQKDKKKEKRKKKEKKSKGKQSSSSSSSNGSSSSTSSGSKSKAKKAKKKKKRKEEAVAPAGEDGTVAEGEASKQRKTATEAAAEPSEAAPAPVPEAAPTTSAAASPFPSVLAALERHDLSSLDEAVGLLTPGADHPDPQRAAIAGALGGLLKASVDPTGINRIAVARAGAIPQLIQLLRSSFAECQLQAAFALHNLTSKNADNKEAVVMENGVSPLLAVLRSGTQEARAQVVGVLRNLSGGSLTCKAAVETAGVVPTIVAMLTKASMHHQQVQANLAVVLYNLCKDSADCRLQVVRAGALPVLVSLLGGGIPQVQQEAADTLRIVVADNDDYCAAAISAGIAPVLGVATGPMAAPKLRQQAGLLKKELAKSGGPEVQKALK